MFASLYDKKYYAYPFEKVANYGFYLKKTHRYAAAIPKAF